MMEPRWQDEYPFASHHLDLGGGVRYHFVDEGTGPAVVLLHGNPTWSFYYRRLIRALTAAGMRAVAPDHIGCGLSDKPQAYPYRLTQHIENLERLLDDHLRLTEVSLVVHDWGGAVGAGYAVRRPERIRRLVVLNTAAFLSPACPWRIRICQAPVFGEFAIRVCNAFAAGALRMATTHPDAWPPAVRQGYLHPYRNYHDRVANLAFVRDIPLHPRHPTWETLARIGEELPRLAAKPMLIGWGMQDFCFGPVFLAEWQRRFPAAEVHRFEDAGHYVLEDAADRLVPLACEFLRPS